VAHVGGQLQAQFMARVRGRDLGRCLVVPVDVGKSMAMALVADHYGEIVVAPFEFDLTETGFALLAAAIARAEGQRSAEIVRVGVETAGHYHRTLVARLRAGGFEVVELNPAAVKEARSQQLLRRLKSDARDVGAMAELMIRGGGRAPAVRTDSLATQAAWVAHRRRKVFARSALANQVIGQLDLVFPGLDGCFSDLLGAKAGRVIVADICDPDRIRRLGVTGLRGFIARRGVTLSTPKATQVVAAARVALRLPTAERAVLGQVLPTSRCWVCSKPRSRPPRPPWRLSWPTPRRGSSRPCPVSPWSGRRTTGRGSVTRPASPTPPAPTAPRAWFPRPTSRPAGPGPASTSAGKVPSSCAKPSSSSDGASRSTTLTSLPTATGSSTPRNRPGSPPSRSATGHTAWPSRCSSHSRPTTPRSGPSRWQRARPSWRRPNGPTRTT